MANRFKNFSIIAVSAVVLFTADTFSQVFERDSVPKYSYSTIPEFWNQMEDIFDDPNFSNAHWGVSIQSLETGEYLYKRNEDKLFIPASTLKLFTTSAGLIALGGEYRWSTQLYANGKIDGSILQGDLVIRGTGDPTISGRFYQNDMLYVFNRWADSLLELGIDEIEGNIIGDDNEFDDIGLGAGWEWDYGSYWYSAPSGAISFNDNTVDIYVTINKQDNSPRVTIEPKTKYVILLNNVVTVPADSITSIDVYRERGTNVVNVFGTIKINSDTVKTYVTINNPTQYSMVILKDVLEKKGIRIHGYPIDIDDMAKTLSYSKMTLLFTHYSYPLRDVVKVINKNSQNFVAEQVLKTIGMEKEYYGSAENGIEASLEIFREMGINPEGMVLADGSGLSRLNLVSPRHVITLLNYMFKSKHFTSFYNSLPIAGIDGSLGTRLKNTRAEGKIRAKPGFLENVRNLSGYAYTGDNEPVAFVIFANNFNVPVKLAENIQDLVCLRLANFRRK
ncbi:MAG: D-alanyl-D-alanine carboxypeptidase/D-alanyl-D-alanine-endopeptidase [Ignavibacteriaceae bacterium]